MKIVYLNPNGILGGAERCLLDLLATLGAGVGLTDWSPRVILGDDGPLRLEVEALGVSCKVLPMPAALASVGDSALSAGTGKPLDLALRAPAAMLAAAGYRRRLGRVLRDARPDLVQTNGMKAHALGTLAAARRIPVIWHMHDDLGGRRLMGRILRWVAWRRPEARLVAVSRAVAASASATLGPRVPVTTILNAVDLDRFQPSPGDGAQLDAEAGLSPAPTGTVRVGLVATFARWKGHDVFLDAVSRIPRDRPARFYVVGGPLYRSAGSQWSLDELRAKAESHGVADRVGFAPHRPDVESVYRALDVVVHASTRPEPFGRVIVEAMACGRAVVVSRAGGAAELFQEGVSALGVKPGDPAELSAALTRLIDDPALRQSLGVAGRAATQAHYDRRQRAHEWAAFYHSTLTKTRTPATIS